MKAAWIPASDHARPPSSGPIVTPTFSNSPNRPMTRAWLRRGEDSEIQAVVAGHRSEAPAVRRTAPITTTPKLPAIAYTPKPAADRMPPAIIVGLRPQRSEAMPPGTSSTPPSVPTMNIAVPAVAADRFRCEVTRSGSRASSPPAPTWNRRTIAAVTIITRTTLVLPDCAASTGSVADLRPWVSVETRKTTTTSAALNKGSADAPYSTERIGTWSISWPPAPDPNASPMTHIAASRARPVPWYLGGRLVPRNERPTGPTATIIPDASRYAIAI